MLVLTRKDGETIRIGNDVVITIRKSKDRRSVVAIEAPKSIRIVRGELGPIDESKNPKKSS